MTLYDPKLTACDYLLTLMPYGLSEGDVKKAAASLNSFEAYSYLACNPYGLSQRKLLPFSVVDSYYLNTHNSDPLSPFRIGNALVFILQSTEDGYSEEREKSAFGREVLRRAGSTCLKRSDAFSCISTLLNLPVDDLSSKLIFEGIHTPELNSLVSEIRVDGEDYYASKVYAYYERTCAKQVNSMLGFATEKSDSELYANIEAAQEKVQKFLSQEQTKAVFMVLKNRLSVITGGPGTGKTQTELVLIEALRMINKKATIRCIAPTGQAAKRMSVATKEPATTIHSALNIDVESQTQIMPTTLSEDLIICDEASMLDMNTLTHLLLSVGKNSRLVFVGDTFQLPSIAAGNVLSELISSKKVPVTCLTKVFRQKDNSIAFNCARIKMGITDLTFDDRFVFIEKSSSKDIAEEVAYIYKEEASRHLREYVAVLSPYRRYTKTGVNNLNNLLRSTFMVPSKTPYCNLPSGIRIYNNDEIVFLRNTKELVNGDTGIALSCRKGEVKCYFRRSSKVLSLKGEMLKYIEPAYAKTVHKSQGLEYPYCIVIIDKHHKSMLSPEIIYTAISRAKEKCYIVGDREALINAITRKDATARTSCLAKLIDLGEEGLLEKALPISYEEISEEDWEMYSEDALFA